MTFVATFGFWLIGAWASFNAPPYYMPLMLAGLLAPFIVSMTMVARSGDRALKREHIDRLWNPKRMTTRTLPAFLFLMPLAVVVSIAVSVMFGGSPAQFALADGFSFSSGAVPVLMLLFIAATLEELGWRGYAFDSLESRFGFTRASVVFGVLWSLWHLPLLLVKDSYQYVILQESAWYALNFFVGIVPMGIIISWICKKNGSSVLATIIFHFIVNISQEALAMTQTTKCIETVVLAVIALGILRAERQWVRASDAALVGGMRAEAF